VPVPPLVIERFNRQDWDGLRELISADARLLVADRYAGSFADGDYLGVYSRMRVTWRLALGDVDGEPAIVLLHFRDGVWEIAGVIQVDVGANQPDRRLPALPVGPHGRINRRTGHCCVTANIPDAVTRSAPEIDTGLRRKQACLERQSSLRRA
jgi:hypothetical protein